MDDLSKIRYLIGVGPEQKLKRNVPKRLVELAGQTAWIERLANLDKKNAKQKAHLFAVRTDAEILKLQGILDNRNSIAPASNFLALDLSQAKQIALAYYHDMHRRNLDSGAYFLSPDDEDYHELLIDAYGDVLAALKEATGEYRTTDPRAVKLLVKYGLISQAKADELNGSGWPLDLASHQPFQALCRMIERADLELANRVYKSWETHGLVISDYNASPTPAAHQAALDTLEKKTIADLKSAYMAQYASRVSQSRAAQYRIPFRVLEEKFGPDRALQSITRDDARTIAEFLPRIPSHATQHYKGITLIAAAELYESSSGKAAMRWSEAEKHLQVIKSAFTFAVNELWLPTDPWRGVAISVPAEQRKKHLLKERTYEPFSIEDLNRLFSLPLYTGCIDDENGCNKPGPNIIRRHRYWAPLIALWTGMRMNEILQLEKADFKRAESGIPFLQVTDEDRGGYGTESFSKKVKSKGAIRDIPIHPALEKLGLVAWIEKAPNGRLFPEAAAGIGEKPSNLYSKRFSSNLKAANIQKPRRLVFHSFRNNFNDALRVAGVPEEFRKLINGWHEQRSMDRRYGRGPTIEQLREHISGIDYPGLRIEHLFQN